MINSGCAAPSSGDLLFELADRSLEEAFGWTFEFWELDAGWKQLSPGMHSAEWHAELGGHDLPRLLDDVCSSGAEPQVTAHCDDDCLLIVPLSRTLKATLAAVTVIHIEDETWATRLAGCVSRELAGRQQLDRMQSQLDRSQSENESLASQVADNIEELVFLRELVGRFELSATGVELRKLAETVLPPLADAVNSECLVMVLAETDDPASPPRVGSTLFRVGASKPDNTTIHALVAEFQEEAASGPVVKNRFGGEFGDRFCHAEDFVLIEISQDDVPIGWLLALNHIDRHEDRDTVLNRSGRYEFGSEEVGLVGSTASILSSQWRYSELVREKEWMLVNVVRAIVQAIDAKYPFTRGKSERIAQYAKCLAEHMGMSESDCQRLYLTGLLHDVGQIGVSDATLTKPGRLTPAECAEIRRHPELGTHILKELDQLQYVLPGVATHHERYDGRGYPHGLMSDSIPLDGRMLAVCDAYDAMLSNRSYRSCLSPQRAAEVLVEGAGTQWDPAVVESFLEIVPEILEIRARHL